MSRRKHCFYPIFIGTITITIHFSAAANDWYVGLQAGNQRIDTGRLADSYIPSYTTSPTSVTSDRTPFRISGGRQLLPWLAAELAYTEYARQELYHVGNQGIFLPPAFLRKYEHFATRETQAWGADLAMTWPPEGPLYAKATIGVQRAKVKLRTHAIDRGSFVGGNGPSESWVSSSNTTNAARYSVGGGWRIGSAWDVSLTYERIGKVGSEFVFLQDSGTGKVDQSVVWAGLTYRF